MGTTAEHLTQTHQSESAKKIKSIDPVEDAAMYRAYQAARVAEKNEAARMARMRRERLSGKLCDRATADNAVVSVVNAMRSALARATSYLPSDLSGPERTRCEAAVRAAIQKSLADAAAILMESATAIRAKSRAPE